jgi:hypothetical protein
MKVCKLIYDNIPLNKFNLKYTLYSARIYSKSKEEAEVYYFLTFH